MAGTNTGVVVWHLVSAFGVIGAESERQDYLRALNPFAERRKEGHAKDSVPERAQNLCVQKQQRKSQKKLIDR